MEQVKGRAHRTVQELMSGVARNNLLPPAISLTETDGTLGSSHGTLIVRYRPSPLGIEVIALGRDRSEGPALIIRVPDADGDASLFQAISLTNTKLPEAFAPASEVIALGWSSEQLRSLK